MSKTILLGLFAHCSHSWGRICANSVHGKKFHNAAWTAIDMQIILLLIIHRIIPSCITTKLYPHCSVGSSLGLHSIQQCMICKSLSFLLSICPEEIIKCIALSTSLEACKQKDCIRFMQACNTVCANLQSHSGGADQPCPASQGCSWALPQLSSQEKAAETCPQRLTLCLTKGQVF